MTNHPLNSGEQSKILIFGLLLVPSLVFLVGVIPVLFIAFGIFMMKKNKDFSHIETSVKNFKGYVYFMLALCLLLSVYSATTFHYEHIWRDGEFLFFFIFLSCVCIAYLIFVRFLFLSPLSAHSEWVEKNGIFATKRRNPNDGLALSELDIIKGEKLKQYSVADELLKWAKLKEEGYISEEDFNEARKKLLKRS